MKTDFHILWIDDNEDFVNSTTPALIRWMDDLGFDLQINLYPDDSKVFDVLSSKDIELIVVDYKLEGDRQGDEVILNIRRHEHYHDIVFYTFGGSPNSIFTRSPDGVFFVDKNDIKERLKKLIDLRIKRVSDVSILRGWTVADAIEIESVLGAVLSKCFGDKETIFADRVIGTEGTLDFGKKHIILNGIVKDRIAQLNQSTPQSSVLASLRACKKILDAFPTEIIEVRNALAHQTTELTEDGKKKVRTKTKAASDIVISHEYCIGIRKNIRKHMKNLRDLEKLI